LAAELTEKKQWIAKRCARTQTVKKSALARRRLRFTASAVPRVQNQEGEYRRRSQPPDQALVTGHLSPAKPALTGSG